MITIRNERSSDRSLVEHITREAFYNQYVPGCTEHYLVHIMREHPDFIPELDFVIEADGQVIGNIMYTKACLTGEKGKEKTVLTFGPISILPQYQRKGYGKLLMEYSFQQAVMLGYDAVIIFGSPANYVSSGFKSCKKYGVSTENGTFPAGMLVKELIPDALSGTSWIYHESSVMHIDEKEAQRFDDTFPKKERKYLPSQEEFFIYVNSTIK